MRNGMPQSAYISQIFRITGYIFLQSEDRRRSICRATTQQRTFFSLDTQRRITMLARSTSILVQLQRVIFQIIECPFPLTTAKLRPYSQKGYELSLVAISAKLPPA